ncbi:MAG: DUF2530 domain-containing protein [Acidobacteriota bacterium]|nr:DUF2530 domain-containing protein [Acidobacteriota bacterium]
MELRDNQPMQHEFGNKTYFVADVEPLDVDGVRTVEVGTAIFFLAALALLPFYGRLQDDGSTWWLWTCLAGMGLGLLGLEYCRRRRKYRTERQLRAARSAPEPPGEPGA